MIINDAFTIGINFLDNLDKFIEKNFRTLKCKDIFNIYFKFFNDLKEFRGTSSGFTGLSELLIFRFLYHGLGGNFEKISFTHDLKKFISKYHNSLNIGQSIPVYIDKRRICPDISIYYSEDLIAVIQIKVYLTNGIKEINKEMVTLEKLKKYHKKLLGLLIIFLSPSRKGKIFSELEKQKNKNEWFNYLILEENDESLIEKLNKYLDLERIVAASPYSE